MMFVAGNSIIEWVYFSLGQSTLVPNYYCVESNDTVEFTLSPSTHSAWEPMSNCFLQQCLLSVNNNNSCRSSTTPCFEYQTHDNTSFCAPGILCSILPPCNSTTYSCGSPDLVCVVNSCCSPQEVCIPIIWTNFCDLGNNLFSVRERNSILFANIKQTMMFFSFLVRLFA